MTPPALDPIDDVHEDDFASQLATGQPLRRGRPRAPSLLLCGPRLLRGARRCAATLSAGAPAFDKRGAGASWCARRRKRPPLRPPERPR